MNKQKFCCEQMEKNWTHVCGVSEEETGVGIIQHYYRHPGWNERIFTKISFCPWCAANIHTRAVDKQFVVIEKANTIKCFNCSQRIFAKEYQEELNPNAGLCFDCQEKINQKLNSLQKYNDIQEKVIAAIKASGSKEAIVVYKAYNEDNQKMPINNLDEIAVQGKARFASSGNVYGRKLTPTDYLSKIVLNPTWLQVAVMANDMIQKTGRKQNVCLEDITLIRQENCIKKMVFVMGSH